MCEVCHKPVADLSRLPVEIQKKVYKPRNDESYDVELDLSPPSSFGESETVEVEIEE